MLSTTSCDHFSTSHLLKNTKSKWSVIVIIQLMLSLLVLPKVITLSGFYCLLILFWDYNKAAFENCLIPCPIVLIMFLWLNAFCFFCWIFKFVVSLNFFNFRTFTLLKIECYDITLRPTHYGLKKSSAKLSFSILSDQNMIFS